MAVLNPRFETPGAYPGEAESWTLRTFVATIEFAAFTPEPLSSRDDFSRWYDFHFSLDECTVVVAFFDPNNEGYEDFEESWGNDYYLTEIPTGHVDICEFDGEDFETMDGAGWDVDPYAWTLEDVSTATAVFDGDDYEVFHLAPYAWEWPDITSEIAMFTEGADPLEAFDEADWPELEE